MNKRNKLRVCNLALLLSVIPVTASGILLECSGGRDICGISFNVCVWWHVVLSSAMLLFVFYHLYLHFGSSGWGMKTKRLKSPVTRWLVGVSALLLVSSVAAFVSWWMLPAHSTLGGIHGKIGFFFILLAVGHTVKRKNYFSF